MYEIAELNLYFVAILIFLIQFVFLQILPPLVSMKDVWCYA